MVKLKSLVIALSMIFTDVTLIFQDNTDHQSIDGAALVFLVTLAVLVSHLKLFPEEFFKRCFYLCLFSEVCILLLIFEVAVRFVWKYIQELVSYYTDNLIVEMYDRKSMEAVVCYMCCGRKNCPKFLSDIFLKLLSFGFLTTAILTI